MAALLSYALTTVSDVKESLGISSGDHTKDNLIIRKINQATRAIESYCGRRFASTVYTNEEYNASQTNQLILRQRPVTALTSLGIRDSGLNYPGFETIDTALYFYDANSGVLDLMFMARGSWNRYNVSYTAGYTTIPEDLAEACATLAAYYVTNAAGTQVGATSKREGPRELKYSNNNFQLSFDNIIAQLGIDSIINSYANSPIMTDR